LDVHFETGGEGETIGEDAGGTAPDAAGEGGYVGCFCGEVDAVLRVFDLFVLVCE